VDRGAVSAFGTSEATQTGPELVVAAQGGDSIAFGELFIANKKKLLRVARRITQNDSDAADIVQDAFAQAFVHLDSFRGDSQFTTWLTQIAVNQALMMLRKRRSKTVRSMELKDIEGAEISDWRLTPEQDYARREQQRLLLAAVGYLNPNLRAVVYLQLAGLSTLETSRKLGLTISAVKSRFLRARIKLLGIFNTSFRPRHWRKVYNGMHSDRYVSRSDFSLRLRGSQYWPDKQRIKERRSILKKEMAAAVPFKRLETRRKGYAEIVT
jgi:RNA polymerase sigma-70 factor (ECF subfamily)